MATMRWNNATRAILERRGIDLDALATAEDPEPAADARAWRAEQARTAIANQMPRHSAAEVTSPEIARWVDAYLDDPRSCPSLLLVGPVGVGKTWSAVAALKAAVVGTILRGRPAPRWRITTHARMVADARPQHDDTHIHTLDQFERADLLLIDDLGSAKSTDWNVTDVLGRVIDTRWSGMRPTIVTTNLAATSLEETLGARVLSRLADSIRIVLTGPDRRRNRGEAQR